MNERPRIFVTPVAGRVVNKLATMEVLPPAGDTVEDASYWRRRERDGDVTISIPQPPKAVNRKTTGDK